MKTSLSRFVIFPVIAVFVLTALACGGSGSASPSATNTPAPIGYSANLLSDVGAVGDVATAAMQALKDKNYQQLFDLSHTSLKDIFVDVNGAEDWANTNSVFPISWTINDRNANFENGESRGSVQADVEWEDGSTQDIVFTLTKNDQNIWQIVGINFAD
ncbi:MAG TPA: hypothetical protein PK299_13980 [Anaerolineales bacterium]|nr:hypothetical protein [Anaerolineales bacterium]